MLEMSRKLTATNKAWMHTRSTLMAPRAASVSFRSVRLSCLLAGSLLVGSVLTSCKADAPKPEAVRAEAESSTAPKAGIEKAPPSAVPAVAQPEGTGPALSIAYSDWPGWVAWDIGLKKGGGGE